MASGIIQYHSYSAPPEKPAGSHVLPAFPSFYSLVCAILDEITYSLQAEGVALVKFRSSLNDIQVEISRGSWMGFDGKRMILGEEVLPLITTQGNQCLNQDMYSNPLLAFSRQKTSIYSIYHTPLMVKGQLVGAIWIGHSSLAAQDTIHFFHSFFEMLALALQTAKIERQKDVIKDEPIHALIRRLTAWDLSTFSHSLRLLPWAEQTAVRLNCPEHELQMIRWATILHDIGKICVPKAILHKPGPLSNEEWALMKLHPGIGARMIASVKRLSPIGTIIETHHEKYDGSGYPNGLKGQEIPLAARILAVVDAYGTMTEERTYKRAFDHPQAVEEILHCTGSHFDPNVSLAFLSQF